MNELKKQLIEGLERGDRRSLSKAITLAESQLKEQYELALEIIEHFSSRKKSRRIGITGTPGVGKSTFINAFGQALLQDNNHGSLAILSIDPSSSVSGGSILGDKTRMTDLSNNDDVFIRPTASGTNAGGLSRNTRLAIIMCEAAGFQDIIVETVGVGQGETELSQLTDLFILLLNPAGGDELQGIKRGIVELADILIVNKADGSTEELAKQTAKDYAMAQHLMPDTDSGWKPPVLTCSALYKKNLDPILSAINEYNLFANNGYGDQHRRNQNRYWVNKNIQAALSSQIKGFEDIIDTQLNKGVIAERIALNISEKILAR